MILDRNGRNAVLPQLFLRLFMAGWLYKYSSFLFGGRGGPDFRTLIRCMYAFEPDTRTSRSKEQESLAQTPKPKRGKAASSPDPSSLRVRGFGL